MEELGCESRLHPMCISGLGKESTCLCNPPWAFAPELENLCCLFSSKETGRYSSKCTVCVFLRSSSFRGWSVR